MPHLTRIQSRNVDQIAMETLGMPGIVLMENAGRSAASHLLPRLKQPFGSVGCVCGRGNNGGDAYVLARHLANHGVPVTLYTTGMPPGGSDASTQADMARRIGLPMVTLETAAQLGQHAHAWAQHAVLVDALLGTGFRGPVRPFLASVINAINQCSDPQIVALDLPSGFDADAGACGDTVVVADMTITFAAEKVAFAQAGAQRWVGKVVVADIGVPPWVIESASGDGKGT